MTNTNGATSVIGVVSIMYGLRKFEERVGTGRWCVPTDHSSPVPVNNLLGFYREHGDSIRQMADTKGWVHEDYNFLNDRLAENNFQIRLNPFVGLGLVAILDRMFMWVGTADPENPKIRSAGGLYPAFRMQAMSEGIRFYRNTSGLHEEPILCLDTKSGDRVFMTKAQKPMKGLALYNMVYQLARAPMTQVYDFDGAVIPQVSIDQQPDVSFMNGVYLEQGRADGQAWRFVQALQQVKFLMNEKGAHLKEAFAGALTLGGGGHSSPDLVFDTPIWLWAMPREGFNMPITAMYIAQDCWKEVKDLNAI